MCIIWAPGVHMLNGKLYGVHDALMATLPTVCQAQYYFILFRIAPLQCNLCYFGDYNAFYRCAPDVKKAEPVLAVTSKAALRDTMFIAVCQQVSRVMPEPLVSLKFSFSITIIISHLCFTVGWRPPSCLTMNLCPLPLPPSCYHLVSPSPVPSVLLVCPFFFYLPDSISLSPLSSCLWLLLRDLPISILTFLAFSILKYIFATSLCHKDMLSTFHGSTLTQAFALICVCMMACLMRP